MAAREYAKNVFINCPFDDPYLGIRNAIVFAVFDCGFIPRCALEENNGGDVRFAKILRLIEGSKFGIHDISRTEPDAATGLPRFNMPLELGVFLAAKHFGDYEQKRKNCLILDFEPYRYQAFVSDIAGHDIQSHGNVPEKAIGHVRDWLNAASGRKTIPGGSDIVGRYRLFGQDLPNLCAAAHVTIGELTYNDYSRFVSAWLKANER